MKKLILITLVFVGSITLSQAQGFLQCEVGISRPTGDLGTYNFENAILKGAGCATTGFNFGARFYSPLKTKNLSMVYTFNLYCNPMDKDFSDQYKSSNPDREFTLPKYFNVPLMAGINYTLPVSKNMAFYSEGTIGLNMLRITKLQGVDEDFEVITKFRPRFNPCFALGAGVVFKDKYIISLNYDGLTSYRPRYHTEAIYSSTTMVGDFAKGDRMSVGIVSLSFGYRLFTASYQKKIVY